MITINQFDTHSWNLDFSSAEAQAMFVEVLKRGMNTYQKQSEPEAAFVRDVIKELDVAV